MNNLDIKRLDHHGLVMGVIKDLGIIDQINAHVGQYDDEKTSVGDRIAAMIINGLGFTDQPLSLLSDFFTDLP
jgi:transposase